MYKITQHGKTVVGCNEDAWRITPHIWFETSNSKNKYGAAFTGSRQDGKNGYAPQSGMNEMGLSFSRLASYSPNNKSNENINKKTISNPTYYLKDILHNCKNITKVKEYISQYDHSYFIEDVFIYIDSSGNYLIVEPFLMTIGNEPTYVLSNFCPSETTLEEALKLERYRKGVEFIQLKLDTTQQFYKTLSDSMSVCRPKIGDGTLLTSIWDLHSQNITLYFYHNYDHSLKFNLTEELKKGDHKIALATLFPINSDFEKLKTYKTPHSSAIILTFLLATGFLFLFSSFYFLISFFRNRNKVSYNTIKLLYFPIGLIFFWYMVILCTTNNIFYFSSPYDDSHNTLISLSSYIPFVMVIIIIPLLVLNFKIIKDNSWKILSKGLLTLNTMSQIILIGLFVYWKLFGDLV